MYKTNTVNGTVANRSQGFATDGTMTDANNSNINWIENRNLSGNSSSIQPISLENRFSIRPAGFESKNRTGACKRATTILS